jgi:hypothetical protein
MRHFLLGAVLSVLFSFCAEAAPFLLRYEEFASDWLRPHLVIITVTTDMKAQVRFLGAKEYNTSSTPDHFGIYNVTLTSSEYSLLSSTLSTLAPKTLPAMHHESICSLTKPGSRAQNLILPIDVTNGGDIASDDVMAIINHINSKGSGYFSSSLAVPPYVDVTGDGQVVAGDSSEVTNYLNSKTNLHRSLPKPTASWICKQDSAWPSQSFHDVIEEIKTRAQAQPERNMRLTISAPAYNSSTETFTATGTMTNEGTAPISLVNPSQTEVLFLDTTANNVWATVTGVNTSSLITVGPSQSYSFNISANVPRDSQVRSAVYRNYQLAEKLGSTLEGYATSNILNFNIATGKSETILASMAPVGFAPKPFRSTAKTVPPIPQIFRFNKKAKDADARDILSLWQNGEVELISSGVVDETAIGVYSHTLARKEAETFKKSVLRAVPKKTVPKGDCEIVWKDGAKESQRSWNCGSAAGKRLEDLLQPMLSRTREKPKALARVNCEKGEEKKLKCAIENFGSEPAYLVNPLKIPETLLWTTKNGGSSKVKLSSKAKDVDAVAIKIEPSSSFEFFAEPEEEIDDLVGLHYDSRKFKYEARVPGQNLITGKTSAKVVIR